jgi:hypothetical protein
VNPLAKCALLLLLSACQPSPTTPPSPLTPPAVPKPTPSPAPDRQPVTPQAPRPNTLQGGPESIQIDLATQLAWTVMRT